MLLAVLHFVYKSIKGGKNFFRRSSALNDQPQVSFWRILVLLMIMWCHDEAFSHFFSFLQLCDWMSSKSDWGKKKHDRSVATVNLSSTTV